MSVMVGMNIKDAEVRRLVEELARRRKTTMTDAVRQAVNEALVHDRKSDPHFVARIMELARRAREASDEPFLTDDDLYDEDGLPR